MVSEFRAEPGIVRSGVSVSPGLDAGGDRQGVSGGGRESRDAGFPLGFRKADGGGRIQSGQVRACGGEVGYGAGSGLRYRGSRAVVPAGATGNRAATTESSRESRGDGGIGASARAITGAERSGGSRQSGARHR